MNSKKKIAVFGIKYYPSRGGSSRVAESIVRHLHQEYDFTVYCYRNEAARGYIPGVRVVEFPEFPFGAAGVFFYYFLCCIHLLLSGSFDLIHAHKTDSALFLSLLRLKGPVVATSQEAPYLRDKWSAVGKAYFRWMERLFMRSPAVLTSVSQPLADYYFRTYGREVHYIPNGVDMLDDRNPDAAQAILEKHSVSGRYFFFAARRIMATKGCHTVLEAARLMHYAGPIVIAGEEEHAAGYLHRLQKLAKGLDVHFIGYVGDRGTLFSLIQEARYFLFPSETEGLSLMMLEAASLGTTPLICSDIPENTQVFGPDEVLFFRNKDAADLSVKLQWAEAHPQEMQQKVANAKAKVRSAYSGDVISAAYADLYEHVWAGVSAGSQPV